ncbi:protein TIFY 10a [Elaeis guineensis]|uniref:Protein TIFY n=1 Tax=Elaeis guineensis var. tenera TaxID=51953 RepID=A0A6I9R407_ELAGV|nr:protein TIFY 10a [Elaeis guineensis]
MADKMGKRTEKTVEKSSFSVTCSRLSQFLKGKGSFGDLGLEIAPRPIEQARGIIRAPTTTMKLMPGVDVSEEDHSENGAGQTAPKSMDLFPQHTGFDSVLAPAKVESSMSSHNKEPEKNQLTIFYAGKVLVFDNFPAEKVKDLMQMAMKESLTAQNLGFTTPSSTAARVDFSHQTSPNIASTTGSQPVVLQNSMPKPPQANASDMPIARRNSLHRFLEKRKDRISTKAPYQVNAAAAAASSAAVDAAKAEDSESWLGLGRPVTKPESSNSEGKR